MQTEPIGFKGLFGEWKSSMNNRQVWSNNIETVAKIHGISEQEIEANAKLMAASKKMAIALQSAFDYPKDDLCAWAEGSNAVTITLLPIHFKIVIEALKEAGL